MTGRRLETAVALTRGGVRPPRLRCNSRLPLPAGQSGVPGSPGPGTCARRSLDQRAVIRSTAEKSRLEGRRIRIPSGHWSLGVGPRIALHRTKPVPGGGKALDLPPAGPAPSGRLFSEQKLVDLERLAECPRGVGLGPWPAIERAIGKSSRQTTPSGAAVRFAAPRSLEVARWGCKPCHRSITQRSPNAARP